MKQTAKRTTVLTTALVLMLLTCLLLIGCAKDSSSDIQEIIVIRAISDKSDGTGNVEYAAFEAEAAAHCAKIVQYMVGIV